MVEELERQIETVEAEMESLQANTVLVARCSFALLLSAVLIWLWILVSADMLVLRLSPSGRSSATDCASCDDTRSTSLGTPYRSSAPVLRAMHPALDRDKLFQQLRGDLILLVDLTHPIY